MRLVILVSLIIVNFSSFGQSITIGERKEIHSKILNDSREFLIYTPPSYHFSNLKSFPVLYLMDGDYNFQYVSGLIELWSSISENIPEMIVVGISAKGTTTYRKNSKPPLEVNDKGNADKQLEFINKELKPYIQNNYKTNGYTILAGHSIGGLFTTYASLTSPQSFQQFIAISPSLWWQNQAMKTYTKTYFLEHKQLSSKLYISLANERGMGVHGFIEMLQNHAPESFIYHFKHFPEESHGSVGLPTYKWALKDIFSDYRIKDKYFMNPESVVSYKQKLTDKYHLKLPIPLGYLRNTVYAHNKDLETLYSIEKQIEKHFPEASVEFKNLIASTLIDKKEYQKAENILNKAIKSDSKYFENYQTQAKLFEALKHPSKAKKAIKKAIQQAKKQKVRQWQMNEIIELSQSLNN